MTTDLPCVDAKFKSEWVAVAPRWITTQCRHFKDECVVYRSTGATHLFFRGHFYCIHSMAIGS
jgi:hypothetical protein